MKYVFWGPVYRHVDREQYASDFVSGRYIQISTFEKCRSYEDEEQGDPGEGTSRFTHSPMDKSHPDFEKVASRLNIGGAGDIYLEGNVATNKISDAYVVCLSYRKFDKALQEKFGSYCVSIPSLHTFVSQVLSAMSRRVPVVHYSYAPVKYKSRDFKDGQDEPVIPFVKPVLPFAIQREIRLVIYCEKGHKYEPFGIEIPNLSGPVSFEKL